MNVNDVFPSKYLKASDLGEARPVVTISHVGVEAIGRDKDQRPVVYFHGKTKGLVLNKTNSKMISTIAGTPETDEWEGVQVQLFATMVEFAGDQVEAIRVKQPKPAKVAAPPPPPVEADETAGDDDAVPF